jgi:hypothetical protein
MNILAPTYEELVLRCIGNGKYAGAHLHELPSTDLHDILTLSRSPRVTETVRGILTARRRAKMPRGDSGERRSR